MCDNVWKAVFNNRMFINAIKFTSDVTKHE